MIKTRTALIIIDPQFDFGNPEGALYVPDGEQIIPEVNKLRAQLRKMNILDVYITQDRHPSDHISFVTSHPGRIPFETIELTDGTKQCLWPPHCIENTSGAALLEGLDRDLRDVSILKGTNRLADSYSGFGSEDGKKERTPLLEYLYWKKTTHIIIVGLAFDYCVSYTACDAAVLGFKTCVVRSATRGISKIQCNQEEEKMKSYGVTILETIDDVCKWIPGMNTDP